MTIRCSPGQLELLFFTSRRRCQDRLLFLYRERVLDRFYPPGPFGSGKPQAHWLLDEAGAILVAASLGVEPKQLGWSRREDWSSHRQLAHRLEANQFVCDLVAATLPDSHMGVTAWDSTRRAAERLDSRRSVRPDAGIILDVPAGPIECFLEWDRATETQERLQEKIEHYQIAEAKLHDATQVCSVLFVVPGRGRITTLRRAYMALEPKREHHRQDSGLVNLDGRWPILATTHDRAARRRATEQNLGVDHRPHPTAGRAQRAARQPCFVTGRPGVRARASLASRTARLLGSTLPTAPPIGRPRQRRA